MVICILFIDGPTIFPKLVPSHALSCPLQLPGRLQTLLRLKQEKEALAKLKDGDPLKQLDPDEASRRRLQEFRDAAQPAKPPARGIQPDEDDEASAFILSLNGVA